jgi:hypothetical protein
MMIHPGFISLVILALIHVLAGKPSFTKWLWHKMFLSAACGVSLSYVFIDLLPSLEKGEAVLKYSLKGTLPYLDRHTYIVALCGILFYLGIDSTKKGKKSAWLKNSGYILFNFIIGATLSDSSNPDIKPLSLFTIAIGLHYFIRDHLYNLSKTPKVLYTLIAMLFLGYFVTEFFHIPDAVIALEIAFASGGILLNVFRYENLNALSKSFLYFFLGAFLYTILLLSIGEIKL